MGLSPLRAAIDLLGDVCLGPFRPVPARLRNGTGNLELLDLVGLHDELHEEAGGGMPCNMAVEGPDAGVVAVELEDDVAVWTDHLHVTPHGV